MPVALPDPWDDVTVVDASGDWKVVRNRLTGVRVALLICAPSMDAVRPVLLRMDLTNPSGGGITGSDLRDIPLQRILLAYFDAEMSRVVAGKRHALLLSSMSGDVPPSNILSPLPAEYSRRNWFYALVAEQYDAVAEKYPNANAANKMVEINSDVAPGSVRRWITKARKRGLLLPADWKHGSE